VLLNMQKIKCILGLGTNNFWLTLHEEDERPDVTHEEEE
jgi:hypothetical protein